MGEAMPILGKTNSAPSRVEVPVSEIAHSVTETPRRLVADVASPAVDTRRPGGESLQILHGFMASAQRVVDLQEKAFLELEERTRHLEAENQTLRANKCGI